MSNHQTYSPVALAAAYKSDSMLTWPLLLFVSLVATKSAVVAARPTNQGRYAGRFSYLGAGYSPQTEPVEEVADVQFEETRLSAMPVRSYRVKARIGAIRKGQLHL